MTEVTQEREWTKWCEQRPPNAPGSYRYRTSFNLLGLPVTAEWTEKMTLCGMGYGDSEWWPRSPCYWDGYRRHITIENLEWSPVLAYDPEGIVWGGIDLGPCPFTGKPAKLETQGQYIGAPLWRTEALWLSSPGVPKRRWADARKMVEFWNTRPASTEPADALAEARDAFQKIVDETRYAPTNPYAAAARRIASAALSRLNAQGEGK